MSTVYAGGGVSLMFAFPFPPAARQWVQVLLGKSKRSSHSFWKVPQMCIINQ